MTGLISFFLSSVFLLPSAFADLNCQAELKSFPIVRFWEGESVTSETPDAAVFNAAAVESVVEFFLSKKRLPYQNELVSLIKKSALVKESWPATEFNDRLESALQNNEALTSPLDALKMGVFEFPHRFESLRMKVGVFMLKTLKERLLVPPLREISLQLNLKDAPDLVATYLPWILGSPEELLEEAVLNRPELMLDVNSKLTSAFASAASKNDNPEHLKTEPTRPTVQELMISLTRAGQSKKLMIEYSRGRFTLEHLKIIMGLENQQTPSWFDAWVPKLFNGMEDLEKYAISEKPKRFGKYIPELVGNKLRMEELRKALEIKGGLLLTSATPGVPLVEEQLQLMLKYAEDLDYPLVVSLTAGRLSKLDPRLLNNPRIFVLTHTIENEFFRLYAIRIPAKNQNPLASLTKRSQINPGQEVFVGHSQQSLKIIPTGSNHLRQAKVWSSGSISRPLYPYKLPIQDRTSQLAKKFHKNGFLVIPKADSRSGLNGEGVQNLWLPRLVEFIDDRDKGGVAGFTDLGKQYLIAKGATSSPDERQTQAAAQLLEDEVRGQQPLALIQGDIHEHVADQNLLRVYRQILQRFSELRYVVPHDKLDGTSHNRHEFGKNMMSTLVDKFRKGELDLHKELMGMVQFVNATHEINPNVNIQLPDDNHGYWLNMLIDNPPQSQVIMNGKTLSELTFAKLNLGIDNPLEYFLVHRPSFVQGLPTVRREAIEGESIFVMHPEKVRILRFGENFAVGPDWRPVHLNFHGHQGSNGAKPSGETHAAGSSASITGDTHRAEVLGNWMSVGTSTSKRIGYNDGGYSSWTNAFALVYPDGTKQLLIYDSLARNFEADPNFVPKPEAFFGRHKLRVLDNDNELLDYTEVTDQHSIFSEAIRRPFRD